MNKLMKTVNKDKNQRMCFHHNVKYFFYDVLANKVKRKKKAVKKRSIRKEEEKYILFTQ